MNNTNHFSNSNETKIRITYHDTDQMGVVYYGNYPTFFEIGRTELLRSTGATYKLWETEHKILLPVVECHLHYHKPAHYDDVLRIKTTLTSLSKIAAVFSYEIFNDETNELLTTGYTKHPFIDETGKIKRIADKLMPEWYRALNNKPTK